jgi:DNA-directed RNA polymerase subunit H|tara:strand:+ start:18855 stop:19097 length:243 start_codon:yes stop_codon:yes gene_type:complete
MTKEVKVVDHVLVPQHILLSKEDGDALCSRYNISHKQIPHISIKDPAIEGLNVEVGDVIKIIRDSETEVKAIFYRVVKKE